MADEDPIITQCRSRLGALISGKWRLDALIGVGGMAAVYAATHRNGSVAAIKLLHHEIASNEHVRSRFLREAYIANKVGHPGTVQVLDDDLDEATGAAYIVMELLKGSTVESKAEKSGGRLPVDETLEIAEQTLAVLEAAHAKEIVHRDLKPENLFITSDGVVKLLDFGIARLREDNAKRTQTGMVMGTPAFMAPEQAMGRWSDVDARTDIWAVGATMFTLLSGAIVHEGETAGEIQVAAATRPARSLARIMRDAPVELVRLVDRALAYERDQRFQDAQSFRAELSKVRVQLRGEKPATSLKADSARATSPKGIAVQPQTSDSNRKKTYCLYDGYDPGTATKGDVERLVKVFSLIDRAFSGQDQYGDTHPETKRRFDEAFRETSSALISCDDALGWNINPYSFYIQDTPIWEPNEPLNRIPYQLFADGVRLMGFGPGLDEEQFKRWLRLITLDPATEMSPEDDLVTLLWDASFEDIFYQAIDSFSEGDQEQRVQFEEKRRQIVASALAKPEAEIARAWTSEQSHRSQRPSVEAKNSQIRRFLQRGQPTDAEAVARAADLELEKDVGRDKTVSLLTVDQSTQALLAARLEPDINAISERFVLAAAQAFIAASAAGDASAVAEPLRRAVDGLSRGAPIKAMEMLRTLREAMDIEGQPEETERLRGAIADALLSPETLTEVLASLPEEQDPIYADYLNEVTYILSHLEGLHISIVLESLLGSHASELQSIVLLYVERVGKGHELQVAALFPRAGVELSLSLVRALARLGTAQAKQAIVQAAKSPHALVRIEALSYVEGASSVQLRNEMRALLEDRDLEVRLAALRAMETYRIGAAGPFLVLRICAAEFYKLPFEEKRQALKSLCTLRPKRAEEVCIQLLSESKLIRTRGFEETRELAALFLAEVASTNPALFLLEEVAKGSKWAYSRPLRQAAQTALDRLAERANQYMDSQAQDASRSNAHSNSKQAKGARGDP